MSAPGPVPELRGGRYAVLGTLGAGSQAETLDALDKRDGRAVAIKRFQVRGAKSWKEVELAEREASVLSTLAHPNLPVYVEHFEEDGALYLVMRKIEGETLSALRKRGGQLDARDVRRFLSDADSALGYLHARVPPIIHRDLKPGNVIRQPDGRFVFVDFGSVRDRLKPEGGSTVVGTFGYMAPEQFQGRALPASDVYAIGATLLALITGQEPENLPHRGLAIDVPRALERAAPPWLERALTAMLEPDPDRRPSRIRPLLGDADDESALRPRRPEAARKLRDEARRLREEARRVRREARSFRRHERRVTRRGAPFPMAPILLIGLLLARMAAWLVFRLFLPLLLTLLWQRGAAARCRQIQRSVDHGLAQAMAGVRGHMLFSQGDVHGGLEALRVEPPEDDFSDPYDSDDDRHDSERTPAPKRRL